jgi:hypothetical protein
VSFSINQKMKPQNALRAYPLSDWSLPALVAVATAAGYPKSFVFAEKGAEVYTTM